nr:diguanylate cyclase [Deltaproteobacteria bacterium]
MVLDDKTNPLPVYSGAAENRLDSLAGVVRTADEWLIRQVLEYASCHEYTRYAPTSAEAWKIAITGLSQSLLLAIERYHQPPELHPDEDYSEDSIAAFGVLEAKQHRSRGVTLPMFLGLMKYFRQSYLDLIECQRFAEEKTKTFRLFLERFFDRVEIGFCTEWVTLSEDEKTQELQETNRLLTNIKNKYITIFESLHDPVLLLDRKNQIENFNYAWKSLWAEHTVSGWHYCLDHVDCEILPSLRADVSLFVLSGKPEHTFERELKTVSGLRHFQIKVKRMPDVNEKLSGTVIILHDITSLKNNERDLKELTIQDALTGLANRRHFDEMIETEWKRTLRNRLALSVIMFDIDFFKEFNDSLGHQTGDDCLRKIADVLRNAMKRAGDLVARYGGDEFAAILPNTPAEQAVELAEQARRNVIDLAIHHPASPISNVVTISAGVTGATLIEDIPPIPPHVLIETADKALYGSKRAGRNQVQLFRASAVAH